jgi:hypothetical protein
MEDSDGNGIDDWMEEDSDGDGQYDWQDSDYDGDGLSNWLDSDFDGDGVDEWDIFSDPIEIGFTECFPSEDSYDLW